MNEILFSPVAYVVNSCNESTNPENIQKLESLIVVLPEYMAALYGVEKCEYLDVIFYMHKHERVEMVGKTLSGEVRGVFASRSPFRPNPIGVTTVKLLRVEDNQLYVTGLDALNGSPIIDIKCNIYW